MIFQWIVWALRSPTLLSWLGIAAELTVAAVIYFEVEQTRRLNFLQRATTENANKERSEIYREFLTVRGATLAEKSDAFLAMLHCNLELKLKCDRQITLFNDLAITTEEWYSRKKPLIEVFPHAPVFVWAILHSYILQRRRDTGTWFAKPLLKFTLRCIDFVMSEKHALKLRGQNSEEGLTISFEDMLSMKKELRGLL
jgi:hypothetical protein